jgi:hypothetical protein
MHCDLAAATILASTTSSAAARWAADPRRKRTRRPNPRYHCNPAQAQGKGSYLRPMKSHEDGVDELEP